MRINLKRFDDILAMTGIDDGEGRYLLGKAMVRAQADSDADRLDRHIIWPIGTLYRDEDNTLRITNGDNYRTVLATDADALDHPYILITHYVSEDGSQ